MNPVDNTARIPLKYQKTKASLQRQHNYTTIKIPSWLAATLAVNSQQNDI